MKRMSEEEEFLEGLEKSKNVVGYIYPVIINKGTLRIVDGKHRKQIDPTWPEKQIEFQDKKSEILFRMHANYRRKVSRKERQTEMLMLASYLEDEGVPREQIASKLAEITPFSLRYVEKLLPKKYKQAKKARKPKAVGELVRHPKTITETTKIATPSEEEVETEIPEMPEMAEEKPAPTAPPVSIVEKPKRVPTDVIECPRCHIKIKTVHCPRCFVEIKIKDVRRMLEGGT